MFLSDGGEAIFLLSEISRKLLTEDQFEMLKVSGVKEQERRASLPIWLAHPKPKSSMVYKVSIFKIKICKYLSFIEIKELKSYWNKMTKTVQL